MAAVFRVCTTLTPPSGGDGECVLFCFKAPILTVCENSPSRFKLSANAASITHWHPILWALGTAMPQWNLLWKALNPAQISPLSLLHAHTYTVFKFMSLYSFSPVKRSDHILYSHSPAPLSFILSVRNLYPVWKLSLKLVITLTAASLSTAVSLIRKQRWEYSVSSYNHIYMKGKLEWKRGILCSTSSAAQPCKRISIIQLPHHPSSPLCNPHGRPTDRQDTTSSAISHPQKLQQWEKERAGSCL